MGFSHDEVLHALEALSRGKVVITPSQRGSDLNAIRALQEELLLTQEAGISGGVVETVRDYLLDWQTELLFEVEVGVVYAPRTFPRLVDFYAVFNANLHAVPLH